MAIRHEVKSGLMNTSWRNQISTRPKMTKEELRKKIERDRDRDAELVVGIFRNLETPRGTLQFGHKIYPGDEFIMYSLKDEERYQIPRGVARHLNNNVKYPEYQQLTGPMGGHDIKMGASADGRLMTGDMIASRDVHRTAFMALDFTDDDLDIMPTPDIIKVSKV